MVIVVVVMEVFKVVRICVFDNMFMVSIVYLRKRMIKIFEVVLDDLVFKLLLVVFVLNVFIFNNDFVDLWILVMFIKERLLLRVVM